MSALKFAAIVVAFLLGAPLAFAQNAPQPIGPNGGASSGGSSNLTFPATVSGTLNSGGIPYFSSSTGMASSAALTANALVIGGGAGEPPAAASGLTYVNSQLLAPSGTLVAPTLSFSAAPGYGVWFNPTGTQYSQNVLALAAGGSEFDFTSGGQIYVNHNNINLDFGGNGDIALIPSSGNVDVNSGLEVGGTGAIAATAEVAIAKETASGTAPGAGYCKLAIVQGTGSTCDLTLDCGTSSSPTIIGTDVGTGC